MPNEARSVERGAGAPARLNSSDAWNPQKGDPFQDMPGTGLRRPACDAAGLFCGPCGMAVRWWGVRYAACLERRDATIDGTDNMKANTITGNNAVGSDTLPSWRWHRRVRQRREPAPRTAASR